MADVPPTYGDNPRHRVRDGDEADSTTVRSSLLSGSSPPADYERVSVHSGRHHPSSQGFTIARKPIPSSTITVLNPGEIEASKEQDDQISKNKHRRHGWQAIFGVWGWELGGCFTFLAALLAMAGILRTYQGKTLPHWPWRISINAVVSILSTLFKGAILLVVAEGISQWKWMWVNKPRRLIDLTTFEDASRGPFGSLKFLLAIPVWRSVASIGAVITILALALDPFIQQVVRYYSCSVDGLAGSATLPRASSYGMLAVQNLSDMYVPVGLQSAITIGLYDPTALNFPLNCPTGNCSYPNAFSSVGYCSKCDDVTNSLSLNVTQLNYVQTLGGTADSGAKTINATTFIYNTTLNTGYGESITLYNILNNDMSAPGYNFTYFKVTSDDLYNSHLWFVLATGKASRSSVNQTLGQVPLQRRWNTTEGYGAAKCVIRPCIRTYNASVYNNTLNETQYGDPFFLKLGYNYFTAVDVPCLSDQQRQTLVEAGYNISANTKWLDFNDTIQKNGSTVNVTIYGALGSDDHNCIYRLAQPSDSTTQSFLSTFLSGSIAARTTSGASTAQLQLYESGEVTFANLEQNMDNIAEAITTYIRQNGDANFTQPAPGIAQATATCVHVYWWWLAYPTVVAVLTLIFFIVTALSTGEAADWKSSILPLLSNHSWAGDGNSGRRCYDEQGRIVPARNMERTARMTTVRLDASTERGWKFEKLD